LGQRQQCPPLHWQLPFATTKCQMQLACSMPSLTGLLCQHAFNTHTPRSCWAHHILTYITSTTHLTIYSRTHLHTCRPHCCSSSPPPFPTYASLPLCHLENLHTCWEGHPHLPLTHLPTHTHHTLAGLLLLRARPTLVWVPVPPLHRAHISRAPACPICHFPHLLHLPRTLPHTARCHTRLLHRTVGHVGYVVYLPVTTLPIPHTHCPGTTHTLRLGHTPFPCLSLHTHTTVHTRTCRRFTVCLPLHHIASHAVCFPPHTRMDDSHFCRFMTPAACRFAFARALHAPPAPARRNAARTARAYILSARLPSAPITCSSSAHRPQFRSARLLITRLVTGLTTLAAPRALCSAQQRLP